jgi:putative membrane protein
MCLNSRIALAAVVSVALGAALVAYAADQNQPNAGQPGAVQPSGGQTGQTQPGANQPVPYQANRMPLRQAQNAQNGQRQDVDLFLIPCLIRANDGEVTLGKIAEQRAQSNEVKEFAQRAIQDHTAGAKQLEQLKASLNGQLRPQSPDNTPVAATLFKINEEVEQNCLANAQRELEQQSGSDFDRCYMGMQVGMHAQLVSALSVFKNHATSPEFRKAIDDLSQIATRHLDDAKKIAKGLMTERSPQAAEKPEVQR